MEEYEIFDYLEDDILYKDYRNSTLNRVLGTGGELALQ